MFEKLRYLLLQVRNPDDPMRQAEVRSFARELRADPGQLEVCDLLTEIPSAARLDRVDVALFGGSGDYSAADDEAWIEPVLDCMRELCHKSQPTFASCWGFQAMARAMGGTVVHDEQRAEVGTLKVRLTPAAIDDPVFAGLGESFNGCMGHEDCVDELPPGATLLASSDRVSHQAYRFDGKPIYCTQFHPELSRDDLFDRLRAYPRYVERIAGVPLEQLAEHCTETPQAAQLLRNFVQHVFG